MRRLIHSAGRRLRDLRRDRAIQREEARRRLVPPLAPALVVPVWNDREGLERLLEQARQMDIFGQIVVVDDGSDPPLPEMLDVTLIRHETSLGGGVARNTGLRAVTTEYMLFFDADDLLTPELPLLLADLGHETTFDFCLFKHADSRVRQEELWGQPDWDEKFWQEAGLAIGTLRKAPRVVWPLLAQTANYPWNKIYRTSFLREHGIGCATTRVHQDIPLHWLGFLSADRVLTSDRICAWHHVSPAGHQVGAGRLTDRAGAERLQVFDALAPVVAATDTAEADWKAALATFCLGLGDWIAKQIDPTLKARFRNTERDWLHSAIMPWNSDLPLPLRDQIASKMNPIEDLETDAAPVRNVDIGGHESMAFIFLTRDAGATFEPLARDIAALTQPGDHVVLIDDGSCDDTVSRIGRFTAMEGWGAGARVTCIATGARAPNGRGTAVDLALSAIKGVDAPPVRATFFSYGAEINRSAFAAARAQAEAGGFDLLAFPLRQWSVDSDRVLDAPDAEQWATKADESSRDRALRLMPPLDRLMLNWRLLAAPLTELRAASASNDETILVRQALEQAERIAVIETPLGYCADPSIRASTEGMW